MTRIKKISVAVFVSSILLGSSVDARHLPTDYKILIYEQNGKVIPITVKEDKKESCGAAKKTLCALIWLGFASSGAYMFGKCFYPVSRPMVIVDGYLNTLRISLGKHFGDLVKSLKFQELSRKLSKALVSVTAKISSWFVVCKDFASWKYESIKNALKAAKAEITSPQQHNPAPGGPQPDQVTSEKNADPIAKLAENLTIDNVTIPPAQAATASNITK